MLICCCWMLQLMLDSWNECIFHNIKYRLQDSAMKLVHAERNGEAFDSQLVIGVRESYGILSSCIVSYYRVCWCLVHHSLVISQIDEKCRILTLCGIILSQYFFYKIYYSIINPNVLETDRRTEHSVSKNDVFYILVITYTKATGDCNTLELKQHIFY